MRQKAREQQRLLREHHEEQIAQLMVEQGLRGLQGFQGFQALQGLPGLQQRQALLHDAQRRNAAYLVAARQAYAQQMSELVARHEQQIAAASRRAPLPLTPVATAHGAYGCSHGGYGHSGLCLTARASCGCTPPPPPAAAPMAAARGPYGCRHVLEHYAISLYLPISPRRVLEHYEAARAEQAEQAEQAELRSLVDGLVSGGARGGARGGVRGVARSVARGVARGLW